MKKLGLVILLLVFGLVPAANALTLSWDTYSDVNATGLRIEKSADNSTWTMAVDNIATDKVASDVPDGGDFTRVYYRMRAFNATDTSNPSNVISFYWSSGGGGYEGLAPVDGVRFLDCDEILLDQNHADYATCESRHTL